MPETKTRAPVLPTREHLRADSEPTLPPLHIQYYRRMRFQRVYPFVVSWRAKGRPGVPQGTEPLTLRLTVAGAQVVPAEQTLEASNPAAKATFHVTPIAKGRLRQEKLEIIQAGKIVQTLSLRSKSVTQRLTLVLLALAILIPALILHYFKYSPLEQIWRDQRNPVNKQVKPRLLEMKETVARHLRDNLPPLPRFKGDPKAVGVPAEELSDPPEWVRDTVEEIRQVPDYIGQFYEDLLVISQTWPLAFYVGLTLLLLALWSLFAHNACRKSVTTEPLPIVRAVPKDVIPLARD